MASLTCSWAQFESGVGSNTWGTIARPHCSQALRTICCQCATRFGMRSAGSLTSTRSLYSGVIVATPASVAFWIAQSKRSPLLRHRPKWVLSGDSVFGLDASPTDNVTERLCTSVTQHCQSRPVPVNNVMLSPTRARNTLTKWWATSASSSTLFPLSSDCFV